MTVHKLSFALIACCLAFAASAQEEAPASRDALAKRVKHLSASNDCDGMVDLFYTQDMDDARRASFTTTIVNYVCSDFGRPITSVAFQEIPADQLKAPKKFGGKPSEYTLPPEGAMVVDYGMSGAGQTSQISLLYGKFDNRYYLITTRQATKP